MKVQELQEIVKLMETSGIAELSIEEENLKLSLKRESKIPAIVSMPQASLPHPVPFTPAPVLPSEVPAPVQSESMDEKNIFVIKSPMVGTFYSAASPDSAPFVTEGAQISPDSIVCILEAMKVMNEVHADCTGTVIEILVKNGSPVEYGQPLFKVRLG